MALAGRREITIELAPDTALLDDVVVSAFGIEREEKAIGYAISEIDGEELREARETNVANALAGRVAGVLVSKPATGPAGSSRVIIRGITSLGAGAQNQPLYVVDGVPIDNTTISSAGEWGGVDGGDGISGINPDDIETMTVLKSAAAAALYGTRAQNGVILITTKRATRDPGIGLEINSNTTVDNVLVATDFQSIYGQGTRGEKPATADAARQSTTTAWGPRLDGSMVVGFDGAMRPYSAVATNNVLDFYDTGLTTTNSVALTATTESAAVRLSGSFLDNNGISPSSGLTRATFNLRGTADFGSRLSGDAKLNVIREDVFNRPRLSDSPGNANYSVFLLAPNIDVNDLECADGGTGCEQRGATEAGIENNPFASGFVQNPYWAATQFVASDEERRVVGVASLKYEFTDWLALQGRLGGDVYDLRRTNVTPFGTAYQPQGSQSEENYSISEINTDFLFLADRQINESLSLAVNLGGNLLFQDREDLTLGGSGFSIPGLEVVTNQGQTNIGFGVNRRRINSLYGQAEFGYNDYLFLTATGRNDWSSTLPEENNSYFYPSLSASFVFSDAFAAPAWLSFGKVRAAVAQVGGDTDAYQLSLTYNLQGSSHLGQPRGGIAQNNIPLAGLKPFRTTEYEAGFDVRTLNNRLGLDFTYYDKTTKDQILGVTIPTTSGYNNQIINAGEIRNSGVEALLTTTPLLTSDFRFDLNFNFAKNNNEVVSLAGEQESLRLGTSRYGGPGTVVTTADVGQPFGTIKGFTYLRDDQGRMVFDDDGLALRGPIDILGVAVPDWQGGVSSTFRYKRLTLTGLVDMRFGGELFSALNATAYGSGLHQETLPGRGGGVHRGRGRLAQLVHRGRERRRRPRPLQLLRQRGPGPAAGLLRPDRRPDLGAVRLRRQLRQAPRGQRVVPDSGAALREHADPVRHGLARGPQPVAHPQQRPQPRPRGVLPERQPGHRLRAGRRPADPEPRDQPQRPPLTTYALLNHEPIQDVGPAGGRRAVRPGPPRLRQLRRHQYEPDTGRPDRPQLQAHQHPAPALGRALRELADEPHLQLDDDAAPRGAADVLGRRQVPAQHGVRGVDVGPLLPEHRQEPRRPADPGL